MKTKSILALILFLGANAANAQKANRTDTITSNYYPSALFSPMAYTEKGNEFHAPNGEPGQNTGKTELTINCR